MKKTKSFGIVTVLLILVIAFSITGTVYSQEKEKIKEYEAYFAVLEQEYVKEIRLYLNENGYTNSGVMLTRVIDEEENREYTITIHHRYFDLLSEEQKAELFEGLMERAFYEENCSFRYNLTGNA